MGCATRQRPWQGRSFDGGEATEGKVILLLSYKFTGDPIKEQEFNHFYSEIHLPHVAQAPGVLGAYRYRAVECSPREYLTVYVVEDEEIAKNIVMGRASDAVGADEHEEWRGWRSGYVTDLSHGRFREIYNHSGQHVRAAGPIILLIRFRFDGGEAESVEFNRWYDNSHAPLVASLPECVGARRYLAADGQPPEYLTMYAFKSVEGRAAVGKQKTPEAIEEHERWNRWRSQYVSGFTFNTFQEISHIDLGICPG